MNVYFSNVDKIVKNNRQNASHRLTFRQKMNNMGDLTIQEFLDKYGGVKVPDGLLEKDGIPWRDVLAKRCNTTGGTGGGTGVHGKREVTAACDIQVPLDKVDLRKATDCTTNARKQEPCGGCVIFAEISLLEFHYCMAKCGKAAFSEQEPLDCDPDITCEGSDVRSTFSYVARKGGVSSEKDYPWAFLGETAGAMDTNCMELQRYPISYKGSIEFKMTEGKNDYEADMAAYLMYMQRPITVVVNLQSELMHGAKKNVIRGNHKCREDWQHSPHFHALTIFGMGTDYKGIDYWLVKNSWGVKWNKRMKGYARILRGENAYCIGVAPSALVVACKYDCEENNPCTKMNRENGLFYFPSSSGPKHYIQCGEWGSCDPKKCGEKTLWHPLGRCVHRSQMDKLYG